MLDTAVCEVYSLPQYYVGQYSVCVRVIYYINIMLDTVQCVRLIHYTRIMLGTVQCMRCCTLKLLRKAKFT